MINKIPVRCILLWLILVIAMILHFNYHIGEIFYGIDIVRPEANGTIPIGTHLIRNIFYHLPILWILILLYFNSKIVRLGLFIISIIYTLSHAMHLVGEMTNPDLSQVPLLTITLCTSFLLNYEQYRYMQSS